MGSQPISGMGSQPISGMGSQPMSANSTHGLEAHATGGEFHLHKIVGGYLVQERDLLGLDETSWKIASTRKPTDAEMADLRFGWLVCKHVKSNAIVVAKNQMLLGAGAGQMDRPSAAKLAIEKAGRADHRFDRRQRRVFPVPGRAKTAAGRGGDCDHPSRRIVEGSGDDRSGERPRGGAGADGTAAFQALNFLAACPQGRVRVDPEENSALRARR